MTVRKDISFAEKNAGLKAALGMEKDKVIEIISDSGLRGRGGAGFPTGLKWKFAAAEKADKKYIVCNADEGEPGTFKDRDLLTEWADTVFEGMTIAAYATGADEGILYLRGEYAFMLEKLEDCLKQRREDKLLGQNIKEGFSFDIHIHLGSGAYVCGEETALIESLEGKRGEARNRPPFPVASGFNGKPTVVNNVETFCWCAAVMVKGAEWFRNSGTEKSAGLKILSISGDVENPGVYEIPFGTTISEIAEAVGAKSTKAAVIGGASGTCVPAKDFSRNISYEDVSTGGSVIFFNEDRNMLDAAENFMEFFAEESCGQCTPCRIGNVKLLEGVRMLKNGQCSKEYLKDLLSLGDTMQISSKCGLGQSSPNVLISIIRHFHKEFPEYQPATDMKA